MVSTNSQFLDEDYINEHKPNSEIILNELRGDNGTPSVQEEIPQDTTQRCYSDEPLHALPHRSERVVR
ncbi:hypothetical protein ACS0TY_003792 [Phlomoides rotata]